MPGTPEGELVSEPDRRDQAQRAARLLAAAAAVRDATGIPRPRAEGEDYAALLTTVREGLGEEGFRTAWQRGYTLSEEDATAEALEERGG
jgi:hypothetical protein